ncbi:MAG: sensor histidine kinase [Cyclobacteriaceae bacterium]
MRLLTLTNRFYLLLLVVLLALWSAVLYFVMQWEVYDNIDEVLIYRKGKLVENIKERGVIPQNDIYHDFVVYPVDKLPAKIENAFQDTLLHKKRKSYDEYRQITSHFEMNGQAYKISMILPHLEQDELIDTIAYTLPVLLVMILIGFALVKRELNKKVWKPFYQILDQFEKFRLDKVPTMNFTPTSIKEFKELQEGVTDLTKRSRNLFLQQKQFTENASHEIQTPLAIVQSKLELIFQQPLSRKQAEILNEVFLATKRLSKINETLLLLTRIENNQFPEKSDVSVRPLVEELIPFFEEQADKYCIEATVDIAANTQIHANPTLLTILFTNLLKNAFTHNKPLGYVRILVNETGIVVTNTGESVRLQTGKVFDRFFTQSTHRSGLGLGLAIVKGICDANNWKVGYDQENDVHKISVSY